MIVVLSESHIIHNTYEVITGTLTGWSCWCKSGASDGTEAEIQDIVLVLASSIPHTKYISDQTQTNK